MHGLDEWRPLIEKMPPERAEKITWVPKETIIEAARMFATNTPASVSGCLGTAQTYNSNNINRCYGILVALTGSIGVEGGGWNWRITAVLRSVRERPCIPSAGKGACNL